MSMTGSMLIRCPWTPSTTFDLNEDTRQTIDSLIPAELPERQRTELLKRMTWKEYLFIIQKH